MSHKFYIKMLLNNLNFKKFKIDGMNRQRKIFEKLIYMRWNDTKVGYFYSIRYNKNYTSKKYF